MIPNRPEGAEARADTRCFQRSNRFIPRTAQKTTIVLSDLYSCNINGHSFLQVELISSPSRRKKNYLKYWFLFFLNLLSSRAKSSADAFQQKKMDTLSVALYIPSEDYQQAINQPFIYLVGFCYQAIMS